MSGFREATMAGGGVMAADDWRGLAEQLLAASEAPEPEDPWARVEAMTARAQLVLRLIWPLLGDREIAGQIARECLDAGAPTLRLTSQQQSAANREYGRTSAELAQLLVADLGIDALSAGEPEGKPQQQIADAADATATGSDQRRVTSTDRRSDADAGQGEAVLQAEAEAHGDGWLDAAATASRLFVSTETLARWRRLGRIDESDYKKVGKGHFYSPDLTAPPPLPAPERPVKAREPEATMPAGWSDLEGAAAACGVSASTLRRFLNIGAALEGIHWAPAPPRLRAPGGRKFLKRIWNPAACRALLEQTGTAGPPLDADQLRQQARERIRANALRRRTAT